MKNFKILILAAFTLTFWNCDDSFDNPVEDVQITSGEADFSKYVALGNSLTAGFQDNALYISGQENSYPSILAEQMMAAGGGAFTVPLMQDDIGGFTDLGLAGKVTLQLVNGSAAPVATPAQSSFDNISSNAPYSNLGVPGAKSFHLLAPGYGNNAGIALGLANPYFARMATSATTTVLADAAAQTPTFFTLWIGANDVLGYALAGGEGMNQAGNTNPATYGGDDISDPNVVAGSIDAMLDVLVTQGGAKGAIANIPSVTSVPFFTTVPTQPIPLTAAQAGQLNQAYAVYNGTLNQLVAAGLLSANEADARQITFTEGANAPVFLDAALTDLTAINPALINMRQVNEEELILLTATAALQSGAGTVMPLGGEFVLSEDEIANINTATTAFNAAIEGLANSYDLAFVDANAKMAEVENSGLLYDGVSYATTFVSGGVFSLDGFHPSTRGYAIIANEFVKSINSKYGSNLREVNPNSFPGINLP